MVKLTDMVFATPKVNGIKQVVSREYERVYFRFSGMDPSQTISKTYSGVRNAGKQTVPATSKSAASINQLWDEMISYLEQTFPGEDIQMMVIELVETALDSKTRIKIGGELIRPKGVQTIASIAEGMVALGIHPDLESAIEALTVTNKQKDPLGIGSINREKLLVNKGFVPDNR